MLGIKRERYIEPLEKVGNYTIENLSKIEGVDMAFPTTLPLQKEIILAVRETHYREYVNNSHRVIGSQVVSHLFYTGGHIVLSDKAIKKYGEETVKQALMWFKAFLRSFEPKHEDKMAVGGWIAENIFDCKAMLLNKK